VWLKVAIDYPERVSHVIVIGSAPVVRSIFAPFPAEGVKLIGGYDRGEGPTLEKLRAILAALVYDPSLLTVEVVNERYEASLDPDAVRVHSLPPGPRQDLTSELERISAPTLMVWGMDDRAGALDVGLLMTRTIAGAEMHIFNQCGHWAQVEHSDAFNANVLTFLRLKT
jgi:2-hydroxy-6-oxonona-2,4-dienedioate hydrolase